MWSHALRVPPWSAKPRVTGLRLALIRSVLLPAALVLAAQGCRGAEGRSVRGAGTPPSRAPSAYDLLDEQGVTYQRWTPTLPGKVAEGSIHERDCGLRDGVRVERGASGIAYVGGLHVAVSFGVRLKRLEEVIQDRALAVLGQRIGRVEHFGAYACRAIRHLPETASQHASGNAIDLAAFITERGARVSLAEHFRKAPRTAATPQARFLRELVEALRQRPDDFPVVLSPEFDDQHQDHLHIEGPRTALRPNPTSR